jgi:hypothetical protein
MHCWVGKSARAIGEIQVPGSSFALKASLGTVDHGDGIRVGFIGTGKTMRFDVWADAGARHPKFTVIVARNNASAEQQRLFTLFRGSRGDRESAPREWR